MYQKSHQHAVGIGYMLIAWLLFTLMTIGTRFATKTVSIPTVLLFQNLIGLMTFLPWIKKHGWGLFQTKRFGLILFRSLISLISIWFSFTAVQKISLVNTMLFVNSSPLWIPFVVWIWLKIPMRHILWPGLIGGFLGIILILKPAAAVIQPGTLFALASGVLLSINMVSLRQLSHTEKEQTVLFYYFFICSLVCLPFTLLEWTAPTALVWGEIIAIGVCLALGQWAFVKAFHYAPASQLGPFCYAAVVYSVLIDWMLYGQTPDFLAWIGIGLVCAGGIWAIKCRAPLR